VDAGYAYMGGCEYLGAWRGGTASGGIASTNIEKAGNCVAYLEINMLSRN
jgi:hypothetical protein